MVATAPGGRTAGDTVSDPEWLRCTPGQWMKKAELSAREDKTMDALKYVAFAHARQMYDAGMSIEAVNQQIRDGITVAE